MVNFYFNKSRITVFFSVFLLASILNVGIVITTAISGSLVLPEILLPPVPVIGLLVYWRYLKAVYRNTPALIIDDDSIYVFDVNQTFLWKDIEFYSLEKYFDIVKSINLKLGDPKAFISSVNNSFIRFIYKLRYFLFGRIVIKVSVTLLRDAPEYILQRIAEAANT